MTPKDLLARARQHHLERVLLGVLIVVFTGFAIAYTRITPIGASPDEVSHLHYITGISDHFRLPPASEPERQQPPLYYLLGAVVAKLTGDDARLIRLLSVALGVLTILTVYAVTRRLFPLRPGLAVGAAALVALLPETQYLAGGINDDNLAWLAGALLVLAGIIVMQSEVLTPRLALGVGLAVALAVLAKETVWVLAALLLVVVVVRHGRAAASGPRRRAARADDRARGVVVRAQRDRLRQSASAAASDHGPAPGARTRSRRCAATSPRRRRASWACTATALTSCRSRSSGSVRCRAWRR